MSKKNRKTTNFYTQLEDKTLEPHSAFNYLMEIPTFQENPHHALYVLLETKIYLENKEPLFNSRKSFNLIEQQHLQQALLRNRDKISKKFNKGWYLEVHRDELITNFIDPNREDTKYKLKHIDKEIPTTL